MGLGEKGRGLLAFPGGGPAGHGGIARHPFAPLPGGEAFGQGVIPDEACMSGQYAQPRRLLGRRRWPPHLIKVTGLGLVLALPMANSAAVVKTETYRYFAGEAERALSPLGSLFATWVINTEPVVYPLGRVMAFLAPPLVSASAEQVASEQDALEAPEIQTVPERAGQGLPPESPPVQPVSSAAAMPEVSRVAHLDVTRDRKSTRLNSS